MSDRLDILKAISEKFPNTPEGASAALDHATKVAAFIETDQPSIEAKIGQVISDLFLPNQIRGTFSIAQIQHAIRKAFRP